MASSAPGFVVGQAQAIMAQAAQHKASDAGSQQLQSQNTLKPTMALLEPIKSTSPLPNVSQQRRSPIPSQPVTMSVQTQAQQQQQPQHMQVQTQVQKSGATSTPVGNQHLHSVTSQASQQQQQVHHQQSQQHHQQQHHPVSQQQHHQLSQQHALAATGLRPTHHVLAATPSGGVAIATVVEVGPGHYKSAGLAGSEQVHYDVGSASNSEQHQSSHLQLPQSMSNNFSYNDTGMYSQPTTVPAYIEGTPHHPGIQTAAMYQSYGGQPNSISGSNASIGVNPQAIGVAQQAYLTPGQAAHQRVPISHTTRASPATVQWLLENYETAEGVSLPRCTLYNHYLRHCAENKIDAVNAASFGKLIRSVFLGLKTRRLGTRGNSKYHYYGIRVKPNSPLARLTDDTQVAMRQQPNPTKRFKIPSRYDDDQPPTQSGNADSGQGASQQLQHHQQYLGDSSGGLPELPDVELDEPLPECLTEDDVTDFAMLYRDHCEALLQVIVRLQFPLVEAIWQTFWKSPAVETMVEKPDQSLIEGTDRLAKGTLIALTTYKPVQEFIRESDYTLYQKLVEVLVPDVLRAVPSGLTQMIRNFAKSLENWLINSMTEMPQEILNVKVAAVSAFSQTLRRYTSLNHLAQAARAVLQNPQQINQMWTDLNKVDFTNVQEQASWVCQCEETMVQKLEQDFKQTLAQQHSLEQWAEWLERVVNDILDPHNGRETFPKAARQFLLKWSFYSSMIIRDLTLRSAASFGSFHLIRLLYDEYMFYLVEHKVADATRKSPLAVMAEFVGLGHFLGGPGSATPEQQVTMVSAFKNGLECDVSLKRESPTLMDEPLLKRPRDS